MVRNRTQAMLLLAMIGGLAAEPVEVREAPCQCEHISHFDKSQATPDGKAGHTYSVRTKDNMIARTPYGTFHVCPDCRKDCLGEYP